MRSSTLRTCAADQQPPRGSYGTPIKSGSYGSKGVYTFGLKLPDRRGKVYGSAFRLATRMARAFARSVQVEEMTLCSCRPLIVAPLHPHI
jgi:hypothetical protein